MSTVSDAIRRAESGDYRLAVECVKKYLHNRAAELRGRKPYEESKEGGPVPEPAPSELYQLAAVLRQHHPDGGSLQEFILQEQRRLDSGIRASGLVLSGRFDPAKWNDAALRADLWLSDLKSPQKSAADDKERPKIQGPPPDPPDTIIRCGDQSYRINNAAALRVSDNEDTVLQAFLGNETLDEPALRKASGLTNPGVAAKILRELATKYDQQFAPAIRLPGGKGKGGYNVRIRKLF